MKNVIPEGKRLKTIDEISRDLMSLTAEGNAVNMPSASNPACKASSLCKVQHCCIITVKREIL